MKALALACLAALGLVTAAWAVTPEAVASKRPPKLLSAWGLGEGVTDYDLLTPLFSDHAIKLRGVHSPSPAIYDAEEAFDFPVGAVLVKTFAYPEGEGLRKIETRVLARTARGWRAWPYVWAEDQSDARLALAGARFTVEATGPDGAPLTVDYRVPNANQCKGCHALEGEITPLGPKARNLGDQLAGWVAAGLVTAPDGAPPAPADWRTGSLEERARAYLDVNCAHCHRRGGPASNSGLFLNWGQTDRTALGVGKRPVAAGRGSGGLAVDIAPGDPDASILVYRMESLEPGVMMPELGRSLRHDEGVALIRAWIAEMDD